MIEQLPMEYSYKIVLEVFEDLSVNNVEEVNLPWL